MWIAFISSEVPKPPLPTSLIFSWRQYLRWGFWPFWWVSQFSWVYPLYAIFQFLSCVQLFETPWTAAHQDPLSFTMPGCLLRFMSIESVILSNHFILCRPLLPSPPSFPASGSFPMCGLFTLGGQSTGVSASVSILSVNIQDWFPFGPTGWISLWYKQLSSVFSSTTIPLYICY